MQDVLCNEDYDYDDDDDEMKRWSPKISRSQIGQLSNWDYDKWQNELNW